MESPDESGTKRPDGAVRAPRGLDRDPAPPPKWALAPVNGRVLDPSTALVVKGVQPRSTVYVGPRLTVSHAVDFAEMLDVLRDVAGELGWDVDPEEPDRRTAKLRFGVRRVTLGVGSRQATLAPDGWTLLQQARARFGLERMRGVSLDHVVFPRPFDVSHPFDISHPFDVSHPSGGGASGPVSTYAIPGSGGRQPVAYVGQAPRRRADAELSARRPVVAILDTGCGAHPWLDPVVRKGVTLDGQPIGHTEPASDPELHGDLTGQLDGVIDPLSGHGTFIAGLVHQACPDADILSWRVVPSAGPIVESDWVAALSQIAELVRRHRAGEDGGHPIDVLSLSMGYYHETPTDELFDPTLHAILEDLSRNGTIVVCSAGNDATSRPSFPAAFAPWAGGGGPVAESVDVLPVVSVGALNPNRTTDALFSNAGPWVRAWEQGAAVLSTMPRFQGGLQPMARTTAFSRPREAIDPDDFRGGFGVWSGTSFAAPLLAGRLAAALVDDLGEEDDAETAVKRGWQAVERCTRIAP